MVSLGLWPTKIWKNELIVVQGHDHLLLQSRSLRMHDLSFTLPTRPQEGVYTCKTRYRMQDAVCELHYIDDKNIELRFKEPQWAVTPGQSAVLYDGDVCLGGGHHHQPRLSLCCHNKIKTL